MASSRIGELQNMVFRCATRGVLVTTGSQTTRERFFADPSASGEFRCRACGSVHQWSADQVTLAAPSKPNARERRRARLLASYGEVPEVG